MMTEIFNIVPTLNCKELKTVLRELTELGKSEAPANEKHSKLLTKLFKACKTENNKYWDWDNLTKNMVRNEIIFRVLNETWTK